MSIENAQNDPKHAPKQQISSRPTRWHFNLKSFWALIGTSAT